MHAITGGQHWASSVAQCLNIRTCTDKQIQNGSMLRTCHAVAPASDQVQDMDDVATMPRAGLRWFINLFEDLLLNY
jgi:hypothetical protein